MLSFLFWNVKKINSYAELINIITNYDIDITILAENIIEPSLLLDRINEKFQFPYFYLPNTGCKRIQTYSKFSNIFFTEVFGNSYTSIRTLHRPGVEDIIVVASHLPSKMYKSPYENQLISCNNLASEIIIVEKKEKHTRTVVIGDLNMNPFEHGIIGAIGLHGMMHKNEVTRKTRMIEGVEYPFFYNPMWNFFGDEHCSSPGTYYYQDSSDVCYYWNIFDQVLIRPDLVKYFSSKNLKILIDDGFSTSLIKENGTPDSDNYSDHLPIYFALDL